MLKGNLLAFVLAVGSATLLGACSNERAGGGVASHGGVAGGGIGGVAGNGSGGAAGATAGSGIPTGSGGAGIDGGAFSAVADAGSDGTDARPDAAIEAYDAASATLVHAIPPAAGPLKAPDGIGTVEFAIRRIYLGDTDRDGTPNPGNGWKQFGYDIDGLISTASSTDICAPRSGASHSLAYPDGDDGIDNSFGKNILPMLLPFMSNGSAGVDATIEAGSWTEIFSLDQLGADTNYNPLAGRAYQAANLVLQPLFDGNDVWPVASVSLLSSTDIMSSKAAAPDGWLVDNTWVSGTMTELDLLLPLTGTELLLPIRHVIVSMKLDADHVTATDGVIAGVMPVELLAATVRNMAGAISPSLCSGSAIDSMITTLEQAADILQDGTQDPSATCNAISIGLGFEASTVRLGAITPASQTPNACPP